MFKLIIKTVLTCVSLLFFLFSCTVMPFHNPFVEETYNPQLYINTGNPQIPIPGGDGSISVTADTNDQTVITWNDASDDSSGIDELSYQVVISTDNNINSVEQAETNGTVEMPWTNNVNNCVLHDLTDGTQYYVTVMVQDTNSNKAVYKTLTITFTDDIGPVPGNSGVITTGSTTMSSIDLSWTKATDNNNTQGRLSYKVLLSASNNITTVTDAQANGTLLRDWTPDIAAHSVTGLSTDTTYYFNVLVKDEAGNITAYTPKQAATLNSLSPVPGNSGAITVADTQADSITITWSAASDDTTPGANLQYKVVRSTANNIDTPANAELNGTVVTDWTANISNCTITGLTEVTTYYINVLVKDATNNISAYASTGQMTIDISAPTAGGSGVITAGNIQTTSMDIGWTAATDNLTTAASITYKVVMSTLNNIATLTTAESNGTILLDWTADAQSVPVTGLVEATTYYFNVLMQDEAGNKATYIMKQATTNSSSAPVPGGSGVITPSNVSTTSIDLSWSEATDDLSTPANLAYKVVYSTTNNVDTVTNAETNGTLVQDWTLSLTGLTVNGLSEAVDYYFNVLVKDEAGTISAYSPLHQATTDTTSPVPGSSGVITPANILATSIDLSWTRASDNYSAQTTLTYKVVRSSSNNISTVLNAEANGALVADWTIDNTAANATGLTNATTYYFTVIVMDEAGNKAVYTTAQAATLDNTNPVAGGSGLISTGSITASSIDLSWTKATDNGTAQTGLEYKVVRSTANDITTVTDAETNGTLVQDWTIDINGVTASGLTDATTYYFNVLVRDTAGNNTIYTTVNDITLDGTAPVPGGSSVVTANNIGSTSVELDWLTAIDNYSAQANLQYKVVSSTAGNIATVADAETNGTLEQDWIADIVGVSIPGLTENTTYYFTVLVKDDQNNKAAYIMKQVDTLSSSAPTPGNTGTITANNPTVSTIDLSWTKATDDLSTQANLQYKIVQSTSNNIDTLSNIQTNGVLVQDWTTDIAAHTVTGLSEATTYYFNIIVRDESLNEAPYTTVSPATTDGTAPIVGGSGVISTSNILATSLDLTWTKASDNYSAQTNLQYKVVRSTTNNISTVSDAETFGTIVQDWTADIATVGVSSLNDSTTYYFNVLVRDEALNKAVYTMKTQDTADGTPPVPGASGTIGTANVGTTTLDLTWTKATDNISAQGILQYKVVRSTSNNIDTVNNAETNGVLVQDWVTDIATVNVTGLNDSTTYYFNVLVRDNDNNKALYTTKTQVTADGTTPSAGGSGVISTGNVTTTTLDLTWTKGSDNVSAQATLQYKVVRSTSNNISTVSDAETNGTLVQDWTTDISTVGVTGLTDSTTYYFNVIVRDEALNKAVYTTKSQTTNDGTVPTAGSSGVINTSNITASTLDLTWTKGSDNVSAQVTLQYKVVRSTSNNIDTVSNAETNGTLVQDWTTNIATVNVTGLNDTTLYYFNVIVRDEALNKTVYTTKSETTADGTAPTAGGTGVISTSNVGTTTLDLTWTKATDNDTAQASLQYKVVRSTSNNISTASDAETNGALVQDWTADNATVGVTGLTDSTTYYFNVIVRDLAMNKTVYTTKTQMTADGTNPTIGGSGVISTSNVGTTTLDLTWTKGTDNISTQANLQYKVVRSTSNNIETVSNAETNGTLVQDWTTNIATVNVTGLSDSTTYYFNVLVRDEALNKAAYTTKSQTTSDGTAPTAGGSGVINASNVTATTLDLTWTKATDNVTAQASLQYKVVQSTSNNISTVSDAETNGTLVQDWTTNIASVGVTGLSDVTTYYFNVIVRDAALNKTVYTTKSQATTDGTAPVVGGSGVISTSNVAATTLDLSWSKASDNDTVQASLQYKIVRSTSNNITTVTDAETNGTLVQDWTTDIATIGVTGLSDATTYYFNVIVRDATLNKSVYTTKSQATTDGTAPTAGGSGVISTSNVGTTTLDLTWTKATDNATAQASLQYKIVRSTSNNIGTVSDAETFGILIQDWTADIATVNVTGLNDSTTYYFNVLVRDAALNKAVYTTKSQTTTDGTTPTAGGSGVISTSNVGTTSLDLTWTKATDNVTAQASLQYKVVQSTSNNISTVSDAETNGTLVQDWTTNIATVNVTGLSDSTTYYFNVLVRDAALNKTAYTTKSQATADGTVPTAGGSGVISTANVTGTTLDLSWTKGTDNVTAQASLQYKVVQSTSNNISTVSDAETNGTLVQDWTTDIATVNVTGLSDSTTYYFNVIVRDAALNKTAYTTKSQATTDGTAPVPGSSGTINTSSIFSTSIDFSWTKATDTVSAQSALQYKMVRSSTNNISTVSDAETNGTLIMDWTTDVSSVSATGLTASTTYYFNILVMDEANNKAVYTMRADTTSGPEEVNDGFDGETTGQNPTGYTCDESAGSIDVVEFPSAGDKSIRIVDTNGSLRVYAKKTFTTHSTGTFIMQADVRADATNEMLSLVLKNDPNTACQINFGTNGYIQVVDNSGTHDLVTYNANTWYTVKMVANIDARTFDVYVDGTLETSGRSFVISTGTISELLLQTSFGDNAHFYVDNVIAN